MCIACAPNFSTPPEHLLWCSIVLLKTCSHGCRRQALRRRANGLSDPSNGSTISPLHQQQQPQIQKPIFPIDSRDPTVPTPDRDDHGDGKQQWMTGNSLILLPCRRQTLFTDSVLFIIYISDGPDRDDSYIPSARSKSQPTHGSTSDWQQPYHGQTHLKSRRTSRKFLFILTATIVS
ncbi:hypothetical protein ACLOJK_024423 [Asimina triloba]